MNYPMMTHSYKVKVMTIREILRTGIIQLIFIFLSLALFAQNGPRKDQKEKIEEVKIAFITKELDLSPDEAKSFWPIYNEMEDKMRAERKVRRKAGKSLKDNFESMSDAEIQSKTTEILDSEIKEAQLKKEYTEKIASAIGYKKATKLLSLEQRFKRELLQKLKSQGPDDRKPPRRPPGGPRG